MLYEAASFYDAEYACKQFGAHLLSIHNDYENEGVLKGMQLQSTFDITSSLGTRAVFRLC